MRSVMVKKLKQIYITIGPSSSGKTHYINNHRNTNCVIISADDIKKELYGNEWVWYANHGTFQELILRFKRILPKKAEWSNTIYVDYPFLTLPTRQQLYNAIKQSNIECTVNVILFKTPLEVCLERNRRRIIPLPEKIIRRQHSRLTYPYEIPALNIVVINNHPDVKEWEIAHHKYNNCCRVLQNIGGDKHALLADRDDSTPSDIHNSNSNRNPDSNIRDIPLATDVHPEERIDPLLEHVLRNRSKLWARSRRSIFNWLKG